MVRQSCFGLASLGWACYYDAPVMVRLFRWVLLSSCLADYVSSGIWQMGIRPV